MPNWKKKFSGEVSSAGSFMVNTDFLPQLWFTPSFTFDYSNTVQPLNVEDERFLYAQWMDIYISYGFNYEFTSTWELDIRAIHKIDFSMQTVDEIWGKGLYDYQENGFYIENINTFEEGDTPSVLTFGFKSFNRIFPNYTTLLSDPDVLALLGPVKDPNSYTKEKDTMNYSYYISDEIQWGDSNWFTNVELIYDNIGYMQQKVIDEQGTFSSEERVDHYMTFELEVPYYSSDNSGVQFNYSLITNFSNQNYYDKLGTTDVLDDEYVKSYYNYFEHVIKATLNYEFPMRLFTESKPVAVISLSADFVNYTERKAKDEDGLYKSILQGDHNYTVSLDIKQNIFDWWNYFFSFSFTKYNSNMDWDAFGLYNYSYITLGLGTGLSF